MCDTSTNRSILFASVPDGPIRRERLQALMQDGSKYPLMTVIAGVGYGKTYTISQYLAQCPANTTWISLSEADNLTGHFWCKFLDSGFIKRKLLLEVFRQLRFPESEYAFDLLFHFISKHLLTEKKCILVFDHFENIESLAVMDFIKRLSMLRLSNVQIIIVSTTIPHVQLSELAMKGILFPVTQEDIAFTVPEYEELLGTMGVTCPVEPEMIHRYFDGQASALILLARYMSGSHRKWTMEQLERLDFFDCMLWSCHSPSVQQALLLLSVFPCFDMELWEMAAGESGESLQDLVDCGFLMEPVPFSGCYVFTGMLQQLLDQKLAESPADVQADVCRFAALYYRQKGDLTETILALQSSRDWGRLLETLEAAFIQGPTQYDYRWVRQKIEAIPEDVLAARPHMELAYAAVMSMDHSHAEATAYLTRLITKYQLAAADGGKTELLGEAYALKGIHAFLEYSDDMLAFFKIADEYLPEGSKLFREYWTCKDHIPPILRFVELKRKSIDQLFLLFYNTEPYMVRLLGGYGGIAMLFGAQCEYLLGNVEQAENYAYQCIRKAEATEQYAIEVEAHRVLLRICLAKGALGNAHSLMKLLRKRVESLHFARLATTFSLLESWFYITIGDLRRVPAWLKQGQFSVDTIWGTNTWEEHSMYARLLLFSERHFELEEFLPGLGLLLESRGNDSLLTRVEYYLLNALTFIRLNKHNRGIKALQAAYEAAGDSNIIMPFAEYGQKMMQLVTEAKNHADCSIPSLWLDKIYQAAKEYVEANSRSQNLVEDFQLTKKEIEVLVLMAQGMRDMEIAKHIATTVPTVKWYARQIYSKMNVKNRTEATLEAIRCGLI